LLYFLLTIKCKAINRKKSLDKYDPKIASLLKKPDNLFSVGILNPKILSV
jgi:hypothetical protein